MFEDMVLSGNTKRTNKPWTVVLSMVVQAVLLAVPDPHSADLHRSAAEDDDGDDAYCSSATTSASPSAASRGGCAHQAASAFDGRRQTGAAESYSEGCQDY